MKTKIAIIIMLITAASVTKAQEAASPSAKSVETPNITLRKIGIGLKTFNLLNELALNSSVMPGNKILVTINALPFLRIQPEFGYYNNKEYSDQISKDLVTKSTSIGIGVYGMWQKGRTNLYAGLKYTSTKNSVDDVNSDYNPNPPYNPIYSLETTSQTYGITGIIVGGEYFLSDHFSVGTDVGIQFTSITSKNETTSVDGPKGSSTMTETSLLFRFYF